MVRIFISYSRQNIDAAKFIATELTKYGAEVFIDYESLQVGRHFPEQLAKEIERCHAMVFLVSEQATASQWVVAEVLYAFKNRKPILPVSLDASELPRSLFFLVGIQQIDFTKWQDTNEAVRSTRKVAEALRTTLQGKARTKPTGSLASAKPTGPLAPTIVKPEWVGKLIPEPFEWCVVPAGMVQLEPTRQPDDYLRQKQPFEVAEFRIARCPITNAQFEVFVTDSYGWRDASWWEFSEDALAWRKEHRQSEAAAFKECADCPRETVSWYAAVAFTRWLSGKTGEKITLPTEQQWQRAAQGDDGRMYPWGNEWNAAKCNLWESGIGATTPVAHYPAGAGPYGVLDLSGNVWEWCLTDFNTGLADLEGMNFRVLRGGSWNDDSSHVSCAHRSRTDPGSGNFRRGFRLAQI